MITNNNNHNNNARYQYYTFMSTDSQEVIINEANLNGTQSAVADGAGGKESKKVESPAVQLTAIAHGTGLAKMLNVSGIFEIQKSENDDYKLLPHISDRAVLVNNSKLAAHQKARNG